MSKGKGLEQAFQVTQELQDLVRANLQDNDSGDGTAGAELQERIGKFFEVTADLYQFLSQVNNSRPGGDASGSGVLQGQVLAETETLLESNAAAVTDGVRQEALAALAQAPRRVKSRRNSKEPGETFDVPNSDGTRQALWAAREHPQVELPDGTHDQGVQDTDSGGCRKCNCKKSLCLKLYCECFAAGGFCGPECSCMNCANAPGHERLIQQAKIQILARSPTAFEPKVLGEGVHKKGCRCRKSRCLKKYCECFQAGVPCTAACRCEGCANCDPSGRQGYPPSALQPMALAAGGGAMAHGYDTLPPPMPLGGRAEMENPLTITTGAGRRGSAALASRALARSSSLPVQQQQQQAPAASSLHRTLSGTTTIASQQDAPTSGQCSAGPQQQQQQTQLFTAGGGAAQVLTSSGLMSVFMSNMGPVLVPASMLPIAAGGSGGSGSAPDAQRQKHSGGDAGVFHLLPNGAAGSMLVGKNAALPGARPASSARSGGSAAGGGQWRLPGGPVDVLSSHINSAVTAHQQQQQQQLASATAASAGERPDAAASEGAGGNSARPAAAESAVHGYYAAAAARASRLAQQQQRGSGNGRATSQQPRAARPVVSRGGVEEEDLLLLRGEEGSAAHGHADNASQQPAYSSGGEVLPPAGEEEERDRGSSRHAQQAAKARVGGAASQTTEQGKQGGAGRRHAVDEEVKDDASSPAPMALVRRVALQRTAAKKQPVRPYDAGAARHLALLTPEAAEELAFEEEEQAQEGDRIGAAALAGVSEGSQQGVAITEVGGGGSGGRKRRTHSAASGGSSGSGGSSPNKRRAAPEAATKASSWVHKGPRGLRRQTSLPQAASAPAALKTVVSAAGGQFLPRLPASRKPLSNGVLGGGVLAGARSQFSNGSRSRGGCAAAVAGGRSASPVRSTVSEEITSPQFHRGGTASAARAAGLRRGPTASERLFAEAKGALGRGSAYLHPSAQQLHPQQQHSSGGNGGSGSAKLPVARDIWSQMAGLEGEEKENSGGAKSGSGRCGAGSGSRRTASSSGKQQLGKRPSRQRGGAAAAAPSVMDCNDEEKDVIAALCNLSNSNSQLLHV